MTSIAKLLLVVLIAVSATEAKATSQLLSDGTFRVTTEHLKEGKWQPGREVVYREDPEAKVVFR